MAVVLTLPKEIKVAMPGDHLKITCKLDKLVPIEKGTKFAFREGNKTVAVGVMTEVRPDTEEDVKNDRLKELKKKGKSSGAGAAKAAKGK